MLRLMACSTQVAKNLAIANFDLAFEVTHAYGISSGQAYTAAAKELAEQGDLEGIQQLLHSMKSTSTDQEYDHVSIYKLHSLTMTAARSSCMPVIHLLFSHI